MSNYYDTPFELTNIQIRYKYTSQQANGITTFLSEKYLYTSVNITGKYQADEVVNSIACLECLSVWMLQTPIPLQT